MKFTALSASAETGENLSFFQRLANTYYDIYINGNIEFTNLNISSSDFKLIRNVVIGLFLGLVIACFASVFFKRVLGGFVRKLLSADALSPDSAKTLEELEYDENLFIRRAVKKSFGVRRVVKCVEEEQFLSELAKKREEYAKKRELDPSLPRFREIEYKQDVDNDRYFIPEDLKYTADIKFESRGTSLKGAIVILLVSIVGLAVILLALPELLEFLDGLAAPSTIV